MSRVVEYELLSATGSEELTAKVTERLAQGWQPSITFSLGLAPT